MTIHGVKKIEKVDIPTLLDEDPQVSVDIPTTLEPDTPPPAEKKPEESKDQQQ